MKNYKQILEAVNRGIKFALDDFEDDEQIQGQVNSKVKYQYGTKEWLDLMNEVIDLGLPSKTLWCKYNLDVNPNQLSKPEDWYGKYYSWGELEGNKPKYNWSNYKFGGSLTKYCNDTDYGLNGFTDNLTELLPEDDAAYQNKKFYNYKFYIPTKEQFEELINYTNSYWVYNYKNIVRLNGRVFEGKNGNQLFIPAAGYRIGYDTYDVSFNCHLWSSSLYSNNPYDAYHLHNNSMDNNYRYRGLSIRPIINL